MPKRFSLQLIIVLTVAVLAQRTVLAGDNTCRSKYVRGYYRSNGTYVAPHYRSWPDGDSANNWSTRGNVNPYTGKPGTRGGLNIGGSGASPDLRDPVASPDLSKPAVILNPYVDQPSGSLPLIGIGTALALIGEGISLVQAEFTLAGRVDDIGKPAARVKQIAEAIFGVDETLAGVEAAVLLHCEE